MTAEELDTLLASDDIARLTTSLEALPGVASADAASDAKGVAWAAVAVVLRAGTPGLELLLIRRAEREDDPWSGHVALPGGRWDPMDADLAATAVRETFEETGLDLMRQGRVLGTLDDVRPRTRALPSIVVRPYVAVIGGVANIAPSPEVAAAFWVPLSALRDRESWVATPSVPSGAHRWGPAFVHGDHIVWGLTERILTQLSARFE
ncbi:MAG: CoA pyrophosphatase [Gemmatimonadaceae bacterium]